MDSRARDVDVRFDRTAHRFHASVEIDAPPERVWSVISDVERWHEWTPSVRRITRMGGGEFVPGSRILIRQPKFPPAMWTLVEVLPGRSFTWVSGAPFMKVVGAHSVEPTASGSRATLSLRYEGALGRWFARRTQGITERYIGFEAAGLRARSENPDFRHAG